MSFHDRLRRLARKQKAWPTGDPEGVTATLQIAARLVNSGWTQGRTHELVDAKHHYDITGALREAVTMAAPKDEVRAWWAAHRALVGALPADYSDLDVYNDEWCRTQAEVVELIKTAGRNHGTVALEQAKGPQA